MIFGALVALCYAGSDTTWLFDPNAADESKREAARLEEKFVNAPIKDDLDLPEAIISSNTNTFHEPVRIGDEVRSRQILRSISDPKTTKLGRGRFWVIDVEYLNQDDVLLGVESYTAFGYRRPEGDGS